MSAAKEYNRLRRNIDRLTDGQASLGEVDWESGRLDKFRVVIEPNTGYYKGGKFVFAVCLQEDYPSYTPPTVYCETDVWHPNINPSHTMEDDDDEDECEDYESERESNVCLNLLDVGIWNPAFGLESLVLGLLFLMHNPNFDDPLNSEFECVKWSERSECLANYMKGEEVYGHVYKADLNGEARNLAAKTKTQLSTASLTIQTEPHTNENGTGSESESIPCNDIETNTVFLVNGTTTNTTNDPTSKLGTNDIGDTGKEDVKIDTGMHVDVGTENSNLATDANLEISEEDSTFKTGSDIDTEAKPSRAGSRLNTDVIEMFSNENSQPKSNDTAYFSNDCFIRETCANAVWCEEGLKLETDANVTVDKHSSYDAANAEFIVTVASKTFEIDSDIRADIEGSKLENVFDSGDSKNRLKPETDTNTCDDKEGSTHETDGTVDGLKHQADANVEVYMNSKESNLPSDSTADTKETFSDKADINNERLQAPSRDIVMGSSANTENEIKTIHESCVDDDEDDATVNTVRLIAFDGGYVLYGGADSELQDFMMAETIATDLQKPEHITCPPNIIVH